MYQGYINRQNLPPVAWCDECDMWCCTNCHTAVELDRNVVVSGCKCSHATAPFDPHYMEFAHG